MSVKSREGRCLLVHVKERGKNPQTCEYIKCNTELLMRVNSAITLAYFVRGKIDLLKRRSYSFRNKLKTPHVMFIRVLSLCLFICLTVY